MKKEKPIIQVQSSHLGASKCYKDFISNLTKEDVSFKIEEIFKYLDEEYSDNKGTRK